MKSILVHSSALALAIAAALTIVAPAAQAASYTYTVTKTPKDTPYLGSLTVNVDLTHAPQRHVFYVNETIPVTPGPFTFYYPKWIPGEHGPTGPVGNMAGLTVKANGQKIPWERDKGDNYTFHVDVPQGVTRLDIGFQFLSPFHGGAFGAGVSVTPNIVDVEFNQVAFYPAGYYSRDITIQPTVELPQGFKFASAMRVASQSGNTIHFKPITFNDFVDSPLISGRYFNRIDLNTGSNLPIYVDVVGDTADDVKADKKQIAGLRSFVKQQLALFQSHHFKHYDLLLTLSDHTNHFGLEHHQSSDDRLGADYFTNKTAFKFGATLMPHEMSHSWNGKFRRPAKLWTPNFNVPMQDNLLWVYEGLTAYLAHVQATRAGLWTPEMYHKALLQTAVRLAHTPGRSWRSLQDTATGGIVSYYKESRDWFGYRRGTDFYQEGWLLWLNVDMKIRQLSHNARSLNNFLRSFYGMDNGSYVTRTYTFQDVVDALNKVQPYDWTKFLRTRLDYTGPNLPENGIQLGGWNVVYNDTPPKQPKNKMPTRMRRFTRIPYLDYSIGLSPSDKGELFGVRWNGPAFKAGLTPGMTIVAINGKSYTRDELVDAVKTAHKDHTPVQLLVQEGNQYKTVSIPYYGGFEYAHLVRSKGTPNYLDDMLKPFK
ncbi:MAG TPA: M61 family peptidase [Rhodanobacteraceae bacterium]|nr:M61 family peptidase [Rhodanobacteraceae bacterium]